MRQSALLNGSDSAASQQWAQVSRVAFGEISVHSSRGVGASASLDCVQFASSKIALLSSNAVQMERSLHHISNCRQRRFVFQVQLQGQSALVFDGQTKMLNTGDAILCDTAKPFVQIFEVDSVTLLFIAEVQQMKQHVASPEARVGQVIAGDASMVSALSALLLSLHKSMQTAPTADEIAIRLERNILDLLATSLLATTQSKSAESAIVTVRRSQVRNFIEANLKDPTLSVGSIAKTFRISPRYLHILFAQEGETVGEYIRRRRMDECHRRLEDPNWRHRSITELAYGWGFNSTTHFARVFKERYGVTPREHRNEKCRSAEQALIH